MRGKNHPIGATAFAINCNIYITIPHVRPSFPALIF